LNEYFVKLFYVYRKTRFLLKKNYHLVIFALIAFNSNKILQKY